MKNGLYCYKKHNEYMPIDNGVITVRLKETKKSIILCLENNLCRYSPAHIDMLFKKNNKVIIRKNKSPHALRLYDDCFVIYPYRAGIPFLFEYVEERNKKDEK